MLPLGSHHQHQEQNTALSMVRSSSWTQTSQWFTCTALAEPLVLGDVTDTGWMDTRLPGFSKATEPMPSYSHLIFVVFKLENHQHLCFEITRHFIRIYRYSDDKCDIITEFPPVNRVNISCTNSIKQSTSVSLIFSNREGGLCRAAWTHSKNALLGRDGGEITAYF